MIKEELTADIAINCKMSPIDCVRYYKEEISDEEADFIIWEKTCYPISTEVFLKQLYNIFNNTNKRSNDE